MYNDHVFQQTIASTNRLETNGAIVTKKWCYDELSEKNNKGAMNMFQHKFKLIASVFAIIFVLTSFTVTSDASSFGGSKPEKREYHSHHMNGDEAFKEIERFFYDCLKEWNVKLPQKETTPKKETPTQKEEANEQEITNEEPKHDPITDVQYGEEMQQQNEQAKVEQTDKEETADFLLAFEREVVALTNEQRVKNGLAPLQADQSLSKVARDKSLDMQMNNYFDHNSPVYGSPFDMMRSYGIQYTSAGENIAKGQRTPEEVVNAWMNSPGHRANILNSDYTHIGVGYVEQGNYWTQQFIRK